jgi:predicted nucleic acid-binding protein
MEQVPVIFLDSWIWIEFFSRGEKQEKALQVIEQIERVEAVISTAILMEIGYIIRRRHGEEKAERIVSIIDSFENLHIIPLNFDVAVYAANIRDKYNGRDGRHFSYGDAIHLATAVLTGCEKLYSGDPDFRGIGELETIII